MLQNVTWKICIWADQTLIIPFHDPRAITYWRIQIGHKSVLIVNIKPPSLIFDWYFQGTLTKFVWLLMRNVQNRICVNVFAPFISWKYCVIKIQGITIFLDLQVTTPSQQFLAKNTESKLTYRHVVVGPQ